MAQSNQFRLLTQRHLLPFFGAQALGTFDDNVYKNVLVILATYQAASYTSMPAGLLHQRRSRRCSSFRSLCSPRPPASSPIVTRSRA